MYQVLTIHITYSSSEKANQNTGWTLPDVTNATPWYRNRNSALKQAKKKRETEWSSPFLSLFN